MDKEKQISFRVPQELYDFFSSYKGKTNSKKGRNILKDLMNGTAENGKIEVLKEENKKLVSELLRMKNL